MITGFINKVIFHKRRREIRRYATQPDSIQREQLEWLMKKAADTEFGKEFKFRQALKAENLHDAFSSNVPLSTYDQIKPWIRKMLEGRENILWPGLCKHFAKSSGTTSDKSKYIPITDDALKRTHMRGGTDCTVIYLDINPKSKVFNGGKALILGGSFSNEILPRGIKAGDLSATLIDNTIPFVNLVRVPRKKIALMSDWQSKLDQMTSAIMNENVSSISGVPSWMMEVLEEVVHKKGARNLSEVWPNLEVFFHGGIAFSPYRERYEHMIPSEKMHYLETYNASEGFFGIRSSWDDRAMQLIIDNKTYYEFIPMSEYDESNQSMKTVPLTGIEIGVNYAMVITTPGLWRYIIGDTVKFTQKDPYKFIITGRTKSFINAFGEELMVSNTDEAIGIACREHRCQIANYTVGPCFATESVKAHHEWIIEFAKQPEDSEAFADTLDHTLQKLNSDYEAKRSKDIFMGRLEITNAPKGAFNAWLNKKRGKLGGQVKIQRLNQTSETIDEMKKMISELE